jgi:hypothetical protein
MKIIAWCYSCNSKYPLTTEPEIEMVWQFQWMIMVIFPVAGIKLESLDFKAKNVSDANKSYILIKITGHFRESIFHWIGIRENDMSVMRRGI